MTMNTENAQRAEVKAVPTTAIAANALLDRALANR